MYFVYILFCADGTLYTGQTKDLRARFEEHRSGRGAKYMRGRLPFQPVFIEICSSRSDALKREIEIKKLPRHKKEALFRRNDGFGVL